ncbi:hypothetical protein WN48_04488 [Eufriesea mexicana]|nr:hypothetical protein WN48_04488 [Eufriesea mexicana]
MGRYDAISCSGFPGLFTTITWETFHWMGKCPRRSIALKVDVNNEMHLFRSCLTILPVIRS